MKWCSSIISLDLNCLLILFKKNSIKTPNRHQTQTPSAPSPHLKLKLHLKPHLGPAAPHIIKSFGTFPILKQIF